MDKIKLKIKRLSEDAKMPFYAHVGEDAGMDLYCTRCETGIHDVTYHTDIAFEIPRGYAGLLFPRSSITKTELVVHNSVGVIDSGYRGEVTLKCLRLHCPNGNIYRVGDRIAQLVIVKLPWVELEEAEELSDSDRGEGGYGSTGR